VEIYSGVPVSPGIAIGEAYLLETEERMVPHRPIEPDGVPVELERFSVAVTQAQAELAVLRNEAGLHAEIDAIFSAHDMLLADPTLRAEVEQFVRQRLVSAEYAVAQVFDALVQRFERLDEQYFAQRASDIRDIERRLLRALLGDRQRQLAVHGSACIIAAHDLSPSQTASLDRDRVLGFLTDVGGPTSHTAIVARAIGLPAVVGLADITSRITDGSMLIVDGHVGQVIVDPDPAQLERYRQRSHRYVQHLADLKAIRSFPAETIDGHGITLMGNIETPDDVDEILESGGDGVGLFRTEFLFEPGKPPPTEEDHLEAYVSALRKLAGRPLVIRTLDFGADKFTPDAAAQAEPNPFLGSRSIRLCLERPSLFMPQLRAILRARSFGDVRCLFPMISSIQELRRAKDMLEKAGVALRNEGHFVDPKLPIGAMIEIPSAAIVADQLIEEVDFFSIGTNDLVQYCLAVDRGNERVAHLYQPAHPALLRLIRSVVRVARNCGKDVSLCGEMAGDVFYTVLLIGMGIRQLSMPPRALPEIKRVVRNLSVEQANEAAEWCAVAGDAEQVQARLREIVDQLVPDSF